jgi:UDP-N-acetylmuramate dehydrogenase
MTTARHDVALSAHTTLRLGGPARRYVEAQTEEQAVAEVAAADRRGEPILVLGGGSNLVVADEGFDGTVLRMAVRGVRTTNTAPAAPAGDCAAVTAQAGENWDTLVRWCVSGLLAGLECLAGIPGLVGATPIQNVGAYGQEVGETVTEVRAYDRASARVVRLSGAQCGFGYRTSMFKRSAGWPGRPAGRTGPTGRFVVLSVTFSLARDPLSRPIRYAELARKLDVPPGERVPLADARAAVLDLRRGKGMVLDPGDPDTRSAGSFFTNPVISQERFAELERLAAVRFGPGVRVPRYPAEDGQVKVPAAWLIERAGFARGYQGDGVRISAKHTLALVNPAAGSTKGLLALAAEIRDGVRAAFGINLEPEPVLVGVSL